MPFVCSKEVESYAHSRGIGTSLLLHMVERSVRHTHPKANRKFHGWLFQVNGNAIECMMPLDDQIAQAESPGLPSGSFLVSEDCEACDGQGCKSCDWSGTVQIRRNLV